VIAPVQNKAGEFLLTPLVRNIVGQRKNLFQFRRRSAIFGNVG
jgi:hypothetical protein